MYPAPFVLVACSGSRVGSRSRSCRSTRSADVRGGSDRTGGGNEGVPLRRDHARGSDVHGLRLKYEGISGDELDTDVLHSVKDKVQRWDVRGGW